MTDDKKHQEKGTRSTKQGAEARKAAESLPPESPVTEWSLARRIVFRFCFVYLGLFCLATQISGSLLPILSFRGLGPLWPLREITAWVSRHVFGVTSGPVYIDPAIAGETAHYWIQAFWILVFAIFATTVWSLSDRKRRSYPRLYAWFRFFIRLGLAAQMLEYGMTKIIPTQFPPPSLNTLVTPVGNLSLNNLLWTSVGAAPAYEIFTGCAELLGGILLLLPRTTMLGALICLMDLSQVFVLNMAYDIGLKLTTLHLLALCLFLLAPELERLVDFFLLDRAVPVSKSTELFRTSGANRAAFMAQILVGVYLVAAFTYINLGYWYAVGPGSPRSPLYGIWDVEQLSIDGQVRAPALNDYDRRWRRIIFDGPDTAVFQRTDDSFARYRALINGNTLALSKGQSRTWKTVFTFRQPARDRLVIQGEMDGYKIQAQFRLVEFDTFRLLNSSFRWIRPSEP